MKLRVALLGILIAGQLVSCQQEPDWDDTNPNNPNNPGNNPGTASGSFEAKIDGQLTTFKVTSATLIRSTQTNEKRVDISGESLDGTKQLILGYTPWVAIVLECRTDQQVWPAQPDVAHLSERAAIEGEIEIAGDVVGAGKITEALR